MSKIKDIQQGKGKNRTIVYSTLINKMYSLRVTLINTLLYCAIFSSYRVSNPLFSKSDWCYS